MLDNAGTGATVASKFFAMVFMIAYAAICVAISIWFWRVPFLHMVRYPAGEPRMYFRSFWAPMLVLRKFSPALSHLSAEHTKAFFLHVVVGLVTASLSAFHFSDVRRCYAVFVMLLGVHIAYMVGLVWVRPGRTLLHTVSMLVAELSVMWVIIGAIAGLDCDAAAPQAARRFGEAAVMLALIFHIAASIIGLVSWRLENAIAKNALDAENPKMLDVREEGNEKIKGTPKVLRSREEIPFSHFDNVGLADLRSVTDGSFGSPTSPGLGDNPLPSISHYQMRDHVDVDPHAHENEAKDLKRHVSTVGRVNPVTVHQLFNSFEMEVSPTLVEEEEDMDAHEMQHIDPFDKLSPSTLGRSSASPAPPPMLQDDEDVLRPLQLRLPTGRGTSEMRSASPVTRRDILGRRNSEEACRGCGKWIGCNDMCDDCAQQL